MKDFANQRRQLDQSKTLMTESLISFLIGDFWKSRINCNVFQWVVTKLTYYLYQNMCSC